MSSHVWCHGPECHTKVTTDRVRGSKGSKVLRTRKVKQHTIANGITLDFYNWFCSMSCYNDFANNMYTNHKLRQTEPLETPIEDPKKEPSVGIAVIIQHQITKIDNESNVG